MAGVHVEVVGPLSLGMRRAVHHLELQVDADLLELSLRQGGQVQDDRLVTHDGHQVQALFVTRRLQQLAGLVQVPFLVGVRDVLEVPRGAGIVGLRLRCSDAPGDAVHQCLLVDGVCDGLAYADVLEGTLVQVEVQVEPARSGLERRSDTLGRIRLDRLRLLERHRPDPVQVAGPQGGIAHGVVQDGAHDDLVHEGKLVPLGVLLPVVLEPFQLHVLLGLPLHELERARADGLGRLGLEAVRVGDERHQRTELYQESVVRLGERELDRVLVDDLHALDGVEVAAPRGLGLLVQEVRVVLPDVLGGQLLAVVEHDALVQVEGIRLAVVADVPGLGQTGRDVALLVIVHQALRHENAHLCRGVADGPVQVRGMQIGVHAESQGAAVLLRGRVVGRGQAERQQQRG